MNGVIFCSTKYGSIAEYAIWIGETTGLPIFNIKDLSADTSKYDFLALGSPVLYLKLIIHKWIKSNWNIIKHKPIIFFSFSGAGEGEKLDGWINDSLPEELISRMNHVVLRGRHILKELTLYNRLLLIITGLKHPNLKQEMKN